jgi:hypothetical protein
VHVYSFVLMGRITSRNNALRMMSIFSIDTSRRSSIRHKRIPSNISSNLHGQKPRHEPRMRSPTSKIPYARMPDGFSQPSEFTLGIKTEEVVEMGCCIRANDGSYAFAEVASKARGEDYHVRIYFCIVFEAKSGFCV